MMYLTAVLTDLLHTQRDPLALCLLLQAYDKLEPPVLPHNHQLSQFNRYYSLWIPEPAREALVSWGCGCGRCSCRNQAFPWETPEVCARGPQLCHFTACRVKFSDLIAPA